LPSTGSVEFTLWEMNASYLGIMTCGRLLLFGMRVAMHPC
jgi:hypothetical protein